MAKKKEKLTEEFLTSFGQARFQKAVLWRDEHITERWKKSNNLYDGKFDVKDPKQSEVLGQGRLFIPKTYSHVQRMLVDILDTFFFDPEEIVDITTWKTIPLTVREITKALLNYRLNNHPINFYWEAYEACLDALKNKVGIFKVYPELKTEKRTFRQPPSVNPATGELAAIEEEKDVIVDFKPRIDCVPYDDVLFDPIATWKDYHRHTIIHRMLKSRDYLKRNGYKNLDKIQPATHVESIAGKDQGSPFDNSVKVEAQDKIYIFEIWTQLDIDGDGLLEPCVYTMAGEKNIPKVIIKDIKKNELPFGGNPPFIAGMAFPESHRLYGKDLPEIVEGLQKETNAIRNQKREATALALRKPILVARHANIDLMSLVNRKIGGVVLGDDISNQSVRELDITDATSGSAAEEARNDQNFYEATSIPPGLLGMPAQSGETATAVTSHTANANKKIEQIIKNLAFTLFIPAFQMLLQLEQEYETDEFIALVTGRALGLEFASGGQRPRDVIQGDFELTARVGINKQTQINKWMMLIDRGNMANQALVQMLMSGLVPPEKAQFVNTMKMFDEILPIVGEKNIEEFKIQAIPPPPPRDGKNAPPKGIASQTRLNQAATDIFGMNNQDAVQGMIGSG